MTPREALRREAPAPRVAVLGSGSWGTTFGKVLADGGALGGPGAGAHSDAFMLRQDPPVHTRLRKLVSKAFTPRAIERLRPRAQAITDELVARALEAGEFDVISGLALPVPATIICEMLGVPIADRDRFTHWTAEATLELASAFSPPDVLAHH